MKDWQFSFICGSLAYISSKVCQTNFGSIMFAVASMCFWLAMLIDAFKQKR